MSLYIRQVITKLSKTKMTTSEQIDKYCRHGLWVKIRKDSASERIVIPISRIGVRDHKQWFVTGYRTDQIDLIGGDWYSVEDLTDDGLEIVEVFQPEYERYEEGEKVVYGDHVLTIETVFDDGTYQFLDEEDYMHHSELKPYIEEAGQETVNDTVVIEALNRGTGKRYKIKIDQDEYSEAVIGDKVVISLQGKVLSNTDEDGTDISYEGTSVEDGL